MTNPNSTGVAFATFVTL